MRVYVFIGISIYLNVFTIYIYIVMLKISDVKNTLDELLVCYIITALLIAQS